MAAPQRIFGDALYGCKPKKNHINFWGKCFLSKISKEKELFSESCITRLTYAIVNPLFDNTKF